MWGNSIKIITKQQKASVLSLCFFNNSTLTCHSPKGSQSYYFFYKSAYFFFFLTALSVTKFRTLTSKSYDKASLSCSAWEPGLIPATMLDENESVLIFAVSSLKLSETFDSDMPEFRHEKLVKPVRVLLDQ